MKVASVTSKNIADGLNILKPNFHLNYGKKRIEKAIRNKRHFIPLKDAVQEVYTGGIFKRVFVEGEEFGLPYISAQHMMNSNPLEIAKLISKKYTPRQEDMTLRESQVLVSCAGSVGNVRLIDKDLDGIIGSQDIIRVISNNSMPYGFIYAYLSSPTAYNYIQSFIYGSVVPRIEPNTLAKLPVPKISNQIQRKCHDLIIKASKLRAEANNILRDSTSLIEHTIEDRFGNPYGKGYSKRNIQDILCLEKRFDAPYNCSEARWLNDIIVSQPHKYISEIADVFHPMLFGKKQLKGSSSKGNALYKSSSMMKLKPETDFWLSTRKIETYQKLQVKEGWILVSRTGTVGNVVRIGKAMNNTFIDDHMIRVNPNEGFEGIVFAYLKSKYGRKLIEFQKYGSVQEVINSDYINRVPFPSFLFEPKILDYINDKIAKSSRNLDFAYSFEKEAIELVENEIESWQKS